MKYTPPRSFLSQLLTRPSPTEFECGRDLARLRHSKLYHHVFVERHALLDLLIPAEYLPAHAVAVVEFILPLNLGQFLSIDIYLSLIITEVPAGYFKSRLLAVIVGHVR